MTAARMITRGAVGERALVRGLMLGPVAGDGADLETYGLNRHVAYHAFRARLTPTVAADDVARYLRLGPGRGRRAGLMTVVHGDVCGFTAALPDNEEPPVAIGVSAARPVSELPTAFRQASRALDTALAFGHRGLVGLEDLGVQASVTTDRELGRLLADRYLTPVRSVDGAGGQILSTVERYLANSGRIEITARALEVHPNTVRYRLGRYEELTGCSLRDVRVLAEIWWALSFRSLPGEAAC